MLLFFPLRVVPILEAINSVILSFKSSLYGKEAIYLMLVNVSLLQIILFFTLVTHMRQVRCVMTNFVLLELYED